MKSNIRLLLIFALFSIPALAQNFAYNGQCAAGGQLVVTQGLTSSGTQPSGGVFSPGSAVIGSFPSCTVTVYITETTTTATIFSSKNSASLTNPFTANVDGSFIFWAVAGQYDVVLSAGGLPSTITLTDIQLGATGGGGGGSQFYQTIQVGGTSSWAQQGILNFVAGTNQTISCANNALNGSTDCTFGSTGGGVTSFTGDDAVARTGAVLTQATDYGLDGIQQIGTGTLSIKKTTGGSLVLGEAVGFGTNYMKFYPDSTGGTQVLITDQYTDQVGLGPVGINPVVPTSNGVTLFANGGPGFLINATDAAFKFASTPVNNYAVDFNATAATFNIPVNLTAGLQVSGNAGLTTQCLLGGGVGWGACTSGSVGSVSGTTNQIVATGTTSVVMSLPSPLSLPGNMFVTQFTNGSDALTLTANTLTTPTGNLLKCRDASLGTLCTIDVLGNATFQTLITSGSGAGYSGFGQGTDNSVGCFAAMTVNGVCIEAPVTVTAGYAIQLPGTGPAATSVMTFGALSSSISAASMTPVTGSSAHILSADATVAGAGANNILTVDGSGNAHNSGVTISAVNPTCNSGSLTMVAVCGAVNSTGLTGNLAATNIISSTVAAGQYNLAVYMNGTANACTVTGGGQFAAKIAYTDSNGAVTRTAGTLSFSTSLPDQQPAVITFWLQSSTSTINVSGTYTACGTPSGGGAFTLDAHYVLTRLQ